MANSDGFYKVEYIVNESGVRVTKGFNSPFLCKKFLNKLKHSKKCKLVSYPVFN